MVWKCPKCTAKFTGKNAFNRCRAHYKAQHGTAKTSKGNVKRIWVYKPPKGRPGFGKRK